MIFFSVNQLYSFCLVLSFGIICCIFNSILSAILLKNYQNNIFKFIFNLFLSLIFSIFLIFSINIFYFGQFHIAIILAFMLGYWWCGKTLSKLLDFLEAKLYYIYIISIRRVWREHKYKSIDD